MQWENPIPTTSRSNGHADVGTRSARQSRSVSNSIFSSVSEGRQAGHASVRLENFTNDPPDANRPKKPNRRLPRYDQPVQELLRNSSQRKHVARLNEFLGTAGRVGQNSNRARAVVRAMPVVMPSAASTETVKSVL